jgi:multiple sugar transport system substrate-binding protein
VQTTFPLQVGGLPVTKSGRAAPVVQNDPFLKAWAEATVATGKHEIGIWDNSPELSTILSEETQAALLGQKTANAAADSMQNRMKASMAKRG